jgi:hypothetical protein
MSKPSLWQRISKNPVWSAVVAGVIATLLTAPVNPGYTWFIGLFKRSQPQLPSTMWLPGRTAYYCYDKGTECYGADHIVFDSTVDNPLVEDERAFLSATEAGSHDPVFDSLNVHIGEVVIIRAYFANDADVRLTGKGKDVAHGVRFRVSIPSIPSHVQVVRGFISAANADPQTVSDGVRFTSSKAFSLQYVLDSAELINKKYQFHLQPDIVSDGVNIGYAKMDGNLGSCYCQAGWILASFKVVPG